MGLTPVPSHMTDLSHEMGFNFHVRWNTKQTSTSDAWRFISCSFGKEILVSHVDFSRADRIETEFSIVDGELKGNILIVGTAYLNTRDNSITFM